MGVGNVAIVTDSGCDLDRDFAQQLDVEILPLGVDIDGRLYSDRVDLSPTELYRRMLVDKSHPRTSQVSPGTFLQTFSRLVEMGRHVVYIGFSSKLSGTYSSAAAVASEVGLGVTAIDSKAASVGQALMVVEAAKMAKSGSPPEEIVAKMESMSARMEHIFCVDSLEYLHRGGRISHTKALVGTLLGIKPLLHFIDGAIYPLENTRSRKKAMARMLDIMEERGVDLSGQTIGLNYAGEPEVAAHMKSAVAERFGCTEFLVSEVGAAIGSHSGPGTFSVFFLGTVQGGGKG